MTMAKRTEGAADARAAELYRQWEDRPWRQKLRGRLRAAWRRYRVARKGW